MNSRVAFLPVNPSIRRKKTSSPACARPAPRRALPPPATPSAVINPKFHAQSHINCRRTLIQLSCLPTHPTAPVRLSTRIPFETRTLRAHKATESWPSRLPLRNAHYPIRQEAGSRANAHQFPPQRPPYPSCPFVPFVDLPALPSDHSLSETHPHLWLNPSPHPPAAPIPPLSKAKDFRVCYIAFAPPRIASPPACGDNNFPVQSKRFQNVLL